MRQRHKLPPRPTDPPPLEGLRVVANPATGGLTAITTHGLEIELTLDLQGLNKLHEMLIEQQRKKDLPAFPAIAATCLAAWTRLPGHGSGKAPKGDITAAVARFQQAKQESALDSLL